MKSVVAEVEISSLDRHFARFIADFAAEDPEVFAAAALVSMATRNGHSCLELREWAGGEAFSIARQISVLPELSRWRTHLEGCAGVGFGEGNTPLVLENDRLYLRRYWRYEEEVARGFIQRGQAACLPVDERLLVEGLSRCIPAETYGRQDGQKLAVLVAMLRPLAVITGGPGTGKTTTVAMILAMLFEQCRARGGGMRVALAAPTGKAAMRLQESLDHVKNSSFSQDWLAGGFEPGEIMTVHRLLGVGGGSRPPRYDAKNPLPYDLVVVDEASMVDLPMMAKLFRALKPEARLILLGDRQQLSSVEPGSVLGDLCQPEALAGCTREFSVRLVALGLNANSANWVEKGYGLADSLVELKHSHRFSRAGGIGRLGEAVRSGDLAGAWEVLLDPAVVDVAWREVATLEEVDMLVPRLIPENFGDFSARSPGAALAASASFRVLCAVRQGPLGAEQMNARIEKFLANQGHPVAVGCNYPGRPVMVLRNDYELQLYNGDVGVILPDAEQAGELKAYFFGPGGSLRKFSPARLPPHQSVYAMTVHKSQGSEFSRVLVVLPERHSAVLSRELLFTALTRARTQVEIWCTRQVFEQALLTTSARHSGLQEKLWGGLPGIPGR